MDVVYNHTPASGQDPKSILDRIVPGYYQRLSLTGAVETSTCCANTASEHRMMEKLMVESVVTWARHYKVDGFRFDLMGHHSKANMLAVRRALDALTPARDGVDGKAIYVYGEGWNFGEVADDRRFVQATQRNMAGTGIGTFSDRLRDAVRGGGPFDADPRVQGFATGLYTDPNAAPGSAFDQFARLLLAHDQIKVGLAGNLRDFTFTDRTGTTVKGSQVDYNGQPAGYAADPSETITYVDAHDNETLFDALQLKLPQATSMADRVRMNTVALATTALAQSPSFWHAGADLLRSKSLDRNSYNSGDWFNRIDWSGRESTWGSGLPPAEDNEDKWPFMRPLLEDPALKPGEADIREARARAGELLRIRFSSPLLRLGTAERIQERVSFPTGGPDQTPGVIVMAIDDGAGEDLDPALEGLVVVFNASDEATTQTVPGLAGAAYALHPEQAGGGDPVVKTSAYDPASGGFTVPARTVAVFVTP
jgi:pullulanase-type alpha-1,6-glucosidase